MYFDFEDYHPDITPVGRAISWREGVLHLDHRSPRRVIFILLIPQSVSMTIRAAARARRAADAANPPRKTRRSCSSSRGSNVRCAEPPNGRQPSDLDRAAQSRRAGAEARNPIAVQPRQQPGARRHGSAARARRRAAADRNRIRPPDSAANPARAGGSDEAARIAIGDAVPVEPHAVAAERRQRPIADRRRIARRRAAQPAALHAERSRSTTRAAAAASSARRFSSTPKASSSVRGSGASSRR